MMPTVMGRKLKPSRHVAMVGRKVIQLPDVAARLALPLFASAVVGWSFGRNVSNVRRLSLAPLVVGASLTAFMVWAKVRPLEPGPRDYHPRSATAAPRVEPTRRG